MVGNNTRTLVIVVIVTVVLLAAFAWWWFGRAGSAPAGQELQQIQAERALKREK